MGKELDPVKYEVFLHRLRSILEEGRMAVSMVSGSPAIAEGGECMTSFYDGNGGAILTASGTLFHVTGSGDAIKKTIEWDEAYPGIQEGDQFFYGDPYIAGTHLMDQIMIKPIFHRGQRVAWVGTMTHTGDIGGVLRGISKEIFHEGIKIQGMKVVESGKIRTDLLRCLTSQCRDPDYVGLDIMARVASNNVCAEGYLRLIEKFGLEFVQAAGEKLRNDAMASISKKLRALPDGTWRERVYWSTSKRVAGKEVCHPFKISITMTKKGEHLSFDAEGSSPQNEDYRNATYIAARSSLFAAIAGFLFWDIPWNAGMIDMVEFNAPEGSVINCRYPASCGYGTQVGIALTGAALGCIARMLYAAGLADYVNSGWGYSVPQGPGYWYGGRNQFGGVVGAGIYDLFARGDGATPYRDGVNTGGFYQNARPCISDVEWIESYFPFLFLARRQATDSGGYGKFQGGMSLESLMVVYGSKDLSVDYSPGPRGGEVRGWGLFGGYPVGYFEEGNILLLTSGLKEKLAGGCYPVAYNQLGAPWGLEASETEDFTLERQLGGLRIQVPEFSILGYQYTSGGGYGDPLDRNPLLVEKDLKNEVVSVEAAAKVYGVIWDAQAGRVDLAGTEERRRQIRSERLSLGERPASSLNTAPAGAAAEKKTLLRLNEYLAISEKAGGERVISCLRCGHEFGPPDGNYKQYALRWTKDVREMKQARPHEPSLTYYQEYICPGCGTLLQVDTWCPALDNEEPLWDIKISL